MTKTICLLLLATLCCVQGTGLRPESDDARFLPSMSGIRDFLLPSKPTLKPKYPPYKPHYRPYKPYEEKPSKPVRIPIPVPLPVPLPGKKAPIRLLVQVANIQEAGGVGGKFGKGFVGNSIGKPSATSGALGSAVGGGLGGAIGGGLGGAIGGGLGGGLGSGLGSGLGGGLGNGLGGGLGNGLGGAVGGGLGGAVGGGLGGAVGGGLGGALGGAVGESLVAPAADVVGNVNTLGSPFGRPFGHPFGNVGGGNFGRPVDGAGSILGGPIGSAADKDKPF